MAWARIDDSFWRNPKVIGCSDAALGLYVRALSYVAGTDTNGKLVVATLRFLRASNVRVKELVQVGLWDEEGDGWVIHDYLEYNPSSAEIAERREIRRLAGSIGGAKSAAKRQASATAPAQAQSNPVPDPVPIPSPNPKSIPPLPPADAGGTSPAARRGLNGSQRKRDQDAAKVELNKELARRMDLPVVPNCVQVQRGGTLSCRNLHGYKRRYCEACKMAELEAG